MNDDGVMIHCHHQIGESYDADNLPLRYQQTTTTLRLFVTWPIKTCDKDYIIIKDVIKMITHSFQLLC